MILNYVFSLVWFFALLGAFVAFQLWQARQIERDTPARRKTGGPI